MRGQGRFKWHEAARLYAGERELPRAPQGQHDSFRALPATPAVDALAALTTAITQQAPFCLSDRPLPDDISLPARGLSHPDRRRVGAAQGGPPQPSLLDRQF